MAKRLQDTLGFKLGNVLIRGLLALGLSPNGTALITVVGRRTGRPRSTPVVVVHYQGQRYVQSPFGNVNWVRNLRAAGTATLSRGRRRERVMATELSPEQAAPIIRSILPTAPNLIRSQFGVTPESSLEEIIQDAAKRAVFAIAPAA